MTTRHRSFRHRTPGSDPTRLDKAVDLALAAGAASGLAMLLVAAIIFTAALRADAVAAAPPASLCFGPAMLLAGFGCTHGAGQ